MPVPALAKKRPRPKRGQALAVALPHEVRFVLVGTRSPGNAGAAARAIMNLGFRRLDFVAPECDPLSAEARRMAVDAAGLLAKARIHDTLDAGLRGAATVVGTSAVQGKQRRPHFRIDALAPELARFARSGTLAFVFGREDHGLADAELDRCTHIAHLLASRDYPSFNLAQSVLLCAYTLRLELEGPPVESVLESPADHAAREAMYAHLARALLAAGFLHDDTAEGMMRRLRRVLGRAALTPGDVKVVRGIARQVLWLAGRSRLRSTDPRNDPVSSGDDT